MNKFGNVADLPYISTINRYLPCPCIALHTAEHRAVPVRSEVRERHSPASPNLCQPSCMLQSRQRACIALLSSCLPRLCSSHATCKHKQDMQWTQTFWRHKCTETAHDRLRQPCERNNQLVWQGCRRLVQGLCAEQAHGRLRDSPGSFSR